MTFSSELEMATRSVMKNRFILIAIILAVLLFQVRLAYPCSWAVGYFHQVTCLRGTVVGMNRHWPRWVRQRVTRDNVNLRLFEYRWPLHDRSEMPLVKSVKTDGSGRFDFGDLQEGHYTLVIDWPSEFGERFDVQIKKQPRPTTSVKIDISPAYVDCTGGHEFSSFQK
jgi:hypothetical protein